MTAANLAVSDVSTVVQYTSVGETTFTFPWLIRETAEIKVSVDAADQVEGASNDYTVTGVDSETGGSVIFNAATVAGEIITIWLDIDIERATGFTPGNTTQLERDLNNEFIKIFRIAQQHERDLGRSLRLPIDDTISGATMELANAAARAEKYLKFSSTGVPELADISASTTVLSRSVIADLLFIDTPEEIAAGVTVVNSHIDPATRSIERYQSFSAGDNVSAGITAAFAAYGVAVIPPGSYKFNKALLDSDGMVLTGWPVFDGNSTPGHAGVTILESQEVDDDAIHVQNRSCAVHHLRITSSAARLAGTSGMGIRCEPRDVVKTDPTWSSMSRNSFVDLDIRRQPGIQMYFAGGGEYLNYKKVTCTDGLSHGLAIDDGTLAGRTQTSNQLQVFNATFDDHRTIDAAGNGIYATAGPANLTFNNAAALNCCYDAAARVSLYAMDIASRGCVFNHPNIEDQRYALTTTDTGATRTANATPSRGMILRSTGGLVNGMHASGILSMLELGASVKNTRFFDPVSFAGAYGADAALTITAATAANPVVVTYTGTDPSNGDNFHITGVVGMTELNNRSFEVSNVNAGANTFELVEPYSQVGEDGTGHTAYASGGTLTRVMDDGVIVPISCEDFHFRGNTDLNTGCGNLLKNQCRDADIWKDTKHYKGTIVSNMDWEINSRGKVVTIDSGGGALIDCDYVILKGNGDVADTLVDLEIVLGGQKGYDGMEVTIVNPNAYTLTLTHDTSMFFRGLVDEPFLTKEARRLRFNETLDRWLDI